MQVVVPLVILLVAGVAGCSEPDQPPANEPVQPPPQAPMPWFALDCPGGDVEGCSTPLPEGPVAQGEPFAAVDPSDSARMAVGVQSRAVLVDGDVEAWPVAVYVSDDAGHSWRLTDVPAPQGAATKHLHGDPVVAFGEDGRLYMSGLLIGPPTDAIGPVAPDVYVASSHDLGETWSEPVLLTDDGDNDRQWLGVGPNGTVVATWQTINGLVVAQSSWSRDGGQTWTPAPDVGPCNLTSRALVDANGYLFACRNYDDPCPNPLYRVEFATNEPLKMSCAGDTSCGTNFLARHSPDRIFWGCLGGNPRLAVSDDGGATWSASALVEDVTPEALDGRTLVFWLETDPSGALHLVTSDFPTAGIPGSVGTSHAVVTYDGSWRKVSVTPLTADGPNPAPMNGEFAGIAFGPAAGIVAYVHNDNSVRTIRLVPGA